MARPRHPDPPPLETDEVRVVAVGTALWGLALLVLLPFRGRLLDDGRGWWLWTCAAGMSLGLWGLRICLRRRAARRARGD